MFEKDEVILLSYQKKNSLNFPEVMGICNKPCKITRKVEHRGIVYLELNSYKLIILTDGSLILFHGILPVNCIEVISKDGSIICNHWDSEYLSLPAFIRMVNSVGMTLKLHALENVMDLFDNTLDHLNNGLIALNNDLKILSTRKNPKKDPPKDPPKEGPKEGPKEKDPPKDPPKEKDPPRPKRPKNSKRPKNPEDSSDPSDPEYVPTESSGSSDSEDSEGDCCMFCDKSLDICDCKEGEEILNLLDNLAELFTNELALANIVPILPDRPNKLPSRKRKEPPTGGVSGKELPKEPKKIKIVPAKEFHLNKISGSLTNLTDLIMILDHKDAVPQQQELVIALKDLNNLIGLDTFKQQIINQILFFIEDLKDKETFLHTVITGDPGTGKTTIVKILARIYKSLGLLKTTNVTIVDRSDLIAEYLGQTAIKTKKVLQSATGGILLIDEVYSLGSADNRDSFAKECIDTLNQYLSEHVDEFICIIAGYKHEIEQCFFKQNSGLKRRFPWEFNISSYTPEDLCNILYIQLNHPTNTEVPAVVNVPIVNVPVVNIDKTLDANKVIYDANKVIYDVDNDPNDPNNPWTFDINKSYILSKIKENINNFKGNGGDTKNLIDKCKIAYARRNFKEIAENGNVTRTSLSGSKKITSSDFELGLEAFIKKNDKALTLCQFCKELHAEKEERENCHHCIKRSKDSEQMYN